jgi:hypothetical protein
MANSAEAAPLRVELDRPGGIYAPGETVRANITLTASGELAVRSLRVVFVNTERYQLRQLSNEGGDYFATDTSEQILAERLLAEQSTWKPGQTQSWQFEGTIPANALPSHPGQVFQIEYAVRAEADRERAVDLHAEARAIVIARWPTDDESKESGDGESAEDDPNTTVLNEGVFTVRLERDAYREGETVAGTFVANPKRDLDIKGIRMELVRREALLEGLTNSSSQLLATSMISGPTRLRAGTNTEFPFRFELPIDNMPSVETARAWGATVLVATLDRRLARDLEASGHVVVYSAQR